MESRILGLETDIKKILKATGGCEQQLKDMNGTIIDLKKKDITHEDKFEKLNEFKNKVTGGIMVLGFILSIIGVKVFLI